MFNETCDVALEGIELGHNMSDTLLTYINAQVNFFVNETFLEEVIEYLYVNLSKIDWDIIEGDRVWRIVGHAGQKVKS